METRDQGDKPFQLYQELEACDVHNYSMQKSGEESEKNVSLIK